MHWRIWIRLTVGAVLTLTAYTMYRGYEMLKTPPKPDDGIVHVTIFPDAK